MQINERSLANLRISPEKRAANQVKMAATVKRKTEARWREIWAEAEKLGVAGKSGRVMARALEIAPSTARKITKFMTKN